MTEIGEILNRELVELLEKLGLETIDKLQSCTDEELLNIPGIGPATLKKIKAWEPEPEPVAKENAVECVSLRYLVFPGGINAAPGDVIPAEYAEEQVAKGKARWR